MTFSVIIPVCNVAPYLRACLDSVLAAAEKLAQLSTLNPQPSTEIICVDDGSTDGSGATLDEYAARTPRLRVFHQQNAGVGAARNRGLDMATGDYVCFIDADDGVVGNFFVRLSTVIDEMKADYVRFDYYSVKTVEEPDALMGERSPRLYDLSQPAEAIQAFDEIVSGTCASNLALNRMMLRNLRFARIPNGEDILFAAQALFRASKVALMDEKLYKYVYRPGSAVRAKTLRHVESVCTMATELKRATDAWQWGCSVRSSLGRKLRNHLLREALADILLLPVENRKNAWKAFFPSLEICAWSPCAWLAGKTTSRCLALWLLFIQRVRVMLLKLKLISCVKNKIRKRG